MTREELDKVVAVAAAHMGLVVTGTIVDSILPGYNLTYGGYPLLAYVASGCNISAMYVYCSGFGRYAHSYLLVFDFDNTGEIRPGSAVMRREGLNAYELR